MNSKKVETILQWVTSQNLKQIQNFLRFCNFYRRFIRNFAKIVKSLIKLIRKNVSFIWNEICKQAFELIVVFESNRFSLMQEMHNQFAIDHSKINKTIRLLKRNHHWSRMIRDVKQYVRNFHICRRVKATRNKYHELLNSLSILDRSWIDIILDFVTRLFNSRNYNAVLMIIDHLSKMHHYILCTIDENETTIEKTIKLFIQHVWKLHELSITMIFDKESLFISLVWDTICKMFKIKTKLFTTFHSKTNEQARFSIKKWNVICVFTSIINKTIEQIDCLWQNTHLMLSFQQSLKCLHSLLITNSSREWASIILNLKKTQSEIESTKSKKEKSFLLWRIFENSLKSIWKKVNKIKLFMLTNIKHRSQITK
jgi:hypothetical protein